MLLKSPRPLFPDRQILGVRAGNIYPNGYEDDIDSE